MEGTAWELGYSCCVVVCLTKPEGLNFSTNLYFSREREAVYDLLLGEGSHCVL